MICYIIIKKIRWIVFPENFNMIIWIKGSGYIKCYAYFCNTWKPLFFPITYTYSFPFSLSLEKVCTLSHCVFPNWPIYLRQKCIVDCIFKWFFFHSIYSYTFDQDLLSFAILCLKFNYTCTDFINTCMYLT